MAVDWHREIVTQLEWHWDNHLRPRLDGLSDDEYLWEPASPAWSIRPRAEATTSLAAGRGDLVIDFGLPEPAPPPVTTIAWRLGHLIVGIFGSRASNHFGDGSLDYVSAEWSPTAHGALGQLDEWYGRWMEGIRGLSPERLAGPVGESEGPFAKYPYAALILHINREAIHHGAEILLLRDLYRSR